MGPHALATALAAWLAFTPWAQAQDTSGCGPLHVLETAFSDPSRPLSRPLGADICQRVDVLGGPTQIHCRWSYDYRAPEALARHDELIADVEACFPATPRQPLEPGVNHPDAYLLTEFHGPPLRIYVSLKDKVGLGKTFVFLRMAPG